MSTQIQLTKPEKSRLSFAQKTFRRLNKKIETLQREQKEVRQELDECNDFYYQKIRPELNRLTAHRKEFLQILYEHYKLPKFLSKNGNECFLRCSRASTRGAAD